MQLISHLEVFEMKNAGLIHFARRLSHGPKGHPDRSELVNLSYPVVRAALDARMGISVGWALDEWDYKTLGLDRSRLPLDILPFTLYDAPVYRSQDFFNSPFELIDLDGYRQKALRSLEKFRQFATAVLHEPLVDSVEFRIPEASEFDVEMQKIECTPAGFMDAIEPALKDPTDIPATQLIVRRG